MDDSQLVIATHTHTHTHTHKSEKQAPFFIKLQKARVV
jgi:hypothetical protein